jgi:hypothetical protein
MRKKLMTAWEFEKRERRLRSQRNFFAGTTVASFALFLLEFFR